MQQVTVTLPHLNPKSLIFGSNASKQCSAELLVHVDREPAEPNHGADADGNRGIYVPGYWFTEDFASSCAECGHVWTPAERAEIDELAIGFVSADDDDDEDLLDEEDEEDLDDEEDEDEDDLDEEDLDDFVDDDGGDDEDEDRDELLEDRV